jgi:hypothetical protein
MSACGSLGPMADLDLQSQPGGKWGFVVENGDLRRTNSPKPSVLRLLLQGQWIGDNGERNGESLSDVTLLGSDAEGKTRNLVETRLGRLVDRGDLESFAVDRVEVQGTTLGVAIQIKPPGQKTEPVYMRMTA